MSIGHYEAKPKAIRAVKYDGTNLEEIKEFTQRDIKKTVLGDEDLTGDNIIIPTLEGEHIASKNDFIIEGIEGEHYPCKPNIFEKSYKSISAYDFIVIRDARA